MNLKKSILLIVAVLLIDQIFKIYIKTNFKLHEAVEVFSWFRIEFVENEGAAWGTKLSDILPISDKTGKLILTVFRLFAISGIGYWLYESVKDKKPAVLLASIALIFAGAFGNIIDSVFYGLIFDHSYNQVATLFAEDPYGTLFHGKVVDMLHFPLIDTTLPDWVPGMGGERFTFFDPVFNIADSAISVGVAILLVFHKKAFPKDAEESQENAV
ncbi:lipoprotein signal peptidase [Neptunitalea lumnitzerae]|uniref:Lipoprotein signal peptidase n=1 Tax=Neptunitalea lumnitzerae TaxID=2965509 RepID=A0ABQ5MMZ7_9FLAO|nr:lipoprotein signal peptidase [Neptunitalea sp. Y10]GLB50768.1 lipoprotein signal peptidase [Neptunitalea sp. Y10]